MSRRTLDAPRFVDNPFEQARDRVGAERPAHALQAGLHVLQDLRLAVRLVDLESLRVLHLSNLERARGALTEQFHQPFVELIDPLAEFVDRHTRVSRVHPSAIARRILPAASDRRRRRPPR